jgi:hypothetical protein
MLILMLALLATSIVIIILSFFLKDPYESLKEEIDQLTLQQAQELYQMKKKLSILEEELLMDDFNSSYRDQGDSPQQLVVHDILKNQVLALAQQGKTINQIAQQSALSAEIVLRILNETRGSNNE